jgi:hypothetical protein
MTVSGWAERLPSSTNLASYYEGDDPKQVEAHPHLTASTAILNAVLQSNVTIDSDIVPFLSSNRFVAFKLFKDPSDLSKLRPIGHRIRLGVMGTSFCHRAGKAILHQFGDDFAQLFAPASAGQFGIAIKSGIDLVVVSSLFQIQLDE